MTATAAPGRWAAPPNAHSGHPIVSAQHRTDRVHRPPQSTRPPETDRNSGPHASGMASRATTFTELAATLDNQARPWLMPAVIIAAAALIGVVIGLLAQQNPPRRPPALHPQPATPPRPDDVLPTRGPAFPADPAQPRSSAEHRRPARNRRSRLDRLPSCSL